MSERRLAQRNNSTLELLNLYRNRLSPAERQETRTILQEFDRALDRVKDCDGDASNELKYEVLGVIPGLPYGKDDTVEPNTLMRLQYLGNLSESQLHNDSFDAVLERTLEEFPPPLGEGRKVTWKPVTWTEAFLNADLEDLEETIVNLRRGTFEVSEDCTLLINWVEQMGTSGHWYIIEANFETRTFEFVHGLGPHLDFKNKLILAAVPNFLANVCVAQNLPHDARKWRQVTRNDVGWVSKIEGQVGTTECGFIAWRYCMERIYGWEKISCRNVGRMKLEFFLMAKGYSPEVVQALAAGPSKNVGTGSDGPPAAKRTKSL